MTATSSDTIAAIATGVGRGGVGIVRISGPRALDVGRLVCPDLPEHPRSHHLYLVRAVAPESGQPLDEVLAAYMAGPRSYTAEDVFEIHGHGGTFNLNRLLAAVVAAGARPAAPGEFTQRAFLLGRLDLTQAEAVADLIEAESAAAAALALKHLDGRLGAAIEQLREQLAEGLMLTEAAIDFSTEEHVYQLDHAHLIARIDEVGKALSHLLGTFDAGRQVREGVSTVIIGRPNAGKSTLFNALVGHERAIVTRQPGTTRDYLEETVRLSSGALRLIDTAGLRDTHDEVEGIGVRRARELAREADLLIVLVDGSAESSLSQLVRAGLDETSADVLAVVNKSDLEQRFGDSALEKLAERAGRDVLLVSLLSEEGHLPIVTALDELVAARLDDALDGVAITRHRHRDALQRAQESLSRAREAASQRLSHEFIAIDLREALDAVGEVVGHITPDDILNRIFGSFCVGK